jgi:hypothetical protein
MVYPLDDHRVVKVTDDWRDAHTAELARRAQAEGKCPNLMRVERVWALPKYNVYGERLYCYVAKRLQPLPECIYNYGVPTQPRSFRLTTWNLPEIVDYFANGGKSEHKLTPWGCAAMNILGIVEDLRSIGVTAMTDYKASNVMIRPGDRVVLSDFGCSQSPHKPEIEEGC